MIHTPVCDLLRIRHPIVLGGMAGGTSVPLVAAVSNAGGLGTMGMALTFDSKVLAETRRINVYTPPGYDDAADARYPVLYMPDGGVGEDFPRPSSAPSRFRALTDPLGQVR